MKKLLRSLFIALIPIAAVSCAQDDMAPAISEPDTPAAETQPTLLRTPAEAISIAEMAVANEDGEGRSERTIRGTSSVKPIVSHTSRGESDTLMYAVDFDEGQGFAIVSASRSVEPLLALIDDGSFDSPETQANESFQFALNCAKLYSMGPTKPTIPDPDGPVDFILSWYADTVFPTPKTTPSIKVRWNQYWPEGMYSPNSISGCGPTAIAQILSYYETPTSISYTYLNHDIASESLNWTEIKKHTRSIRKPSDDIQSHLQGCYASTATHRTIGRLVRQIGHLSNADTSNPNATSTTTAADIATLKTLLPKQQFSTGNSGENLFNSLIKLKNSVAYVRGAENTTSIGHAWVADGTWQLGMKITEYRWTYLDDVGKYMYMPVSVRDTLKSYLHFNWGWSGNSNGYFLTNMFNPAYALEYDDVYDGGHQDINLNSGIYYMVVYGYTLKI